MKLLAAFMLTVIIAAPDLAAQQPELRGIWMTPRSGSGFWTKAEIARAMDSVANANFNVVYFNAWSRGWPLWRSDYFFSETGFYTDPAAGNRDILQEAIAEAHRRGLEIEAWMEYGFVAWWDGYSLPGYPKGPLLARHPDWSARKRDGSDGFESGHVGVFYWMSHNHPAVQHFMVKLHQEIALKYDVDGIELDRIRYPHLDCGYDSASVARYQLHFGTPPPQNISDPQWMRWRADQLIAFHRSAYDSIKAANPNVTVSNAPSHYSSGSNYPSYENFLQDWRAWLNSRILDNAQIQMYVMPGTLAQYIPSALSGLQDSVRRYAYAGIAPKTTNFTLSASETIQLITVCRNAGLRGHAFWYYNDIVDLGYFGVIRSQAYPTKVPVPDRRSGWREEGRINDDTTGNRSSGWNHISLPPGGSITAWNRNFAYTNDSEPRYVEYMMNIPATAYYDVYAHQVGGLLNTTSSAPYQLHDLDGVRTIVVNQAEATSVGWFRLGTARLGVGPNQMVIRLTNTGIGAGKFVVSDAVMLQINRKLSPGVNITSVGQEQNVPASIRLLPNYPNPFNPSTNVRFSLPSSTQVKLDVFDTLGRHISTLVDGTLDRGLHSTPFDGNGLASGLYLVRLQTPGSTYAKKIILLR